MSAISNRTDIIEQAQEWVSVLVEAELDAKGRPTIKARKLDNVRGTQEQLAVFLQNLRDFIKAEQEAFDKFIKR